METKIAKSISWIFHPLFIPVLGIFLLFQTNTYIKYSIPFENQKIIYGIFFINTCLFPLIMTFFLIKRGFIKDIYLSNKQERYAPLIITAIALFSTYYLLKKVAIPRIIYSFAFASFVAILILLILNFWWKISMHCTGIGGLIGMIAGMSLRFNLNLNLYIMIVIFVAGLIGYSRLRLSSHRPFEIYLGYILGFFTVWFVVSWEMG